MKNNIKWFFIGVIVVVVIVLGVYLVGKNGNGGRSLLSGNVDSVQNSKGMYDYSINSMINEISDTGVILGEKVIYTANVALKTDDYENNIQKIKDIITANNAGIANFSENSNNRSAANKKYMYANINIRVPQENFLNFTEQIKNCGMEVSSYNENTQDITEAYMDIESKLTSLKQQEQILNDLLKQAKNVSEIIEINSQKQYVIQQIEYNTKMQQTYDNKIAYSTVTISIQEVDSTQVTQKGFGQRLADTIMSGIEGLKFLTLNLLLLIVYLLPFALVIGVVILIIVLVIKKAKKRKTGNATQDTENNKE